MLIQISTDSNEVSDVTLQAVKKLAEYAKDKTILSSFTSIVTNGDEITIYPDYKKEY